MRRFSVFSYTFLNLKERKVVRRLGIEDEVLFIKNYTVRLNSFMFIMWKDLLRSLRGCSLIPRSETCSASPWRKKSLEIDDYLTTYRISLSPSIPSITDTIPWTFLREMNEDTESRDHIRSAAGPRFNSPVRNHTRSLPYLYLYLVIHYYDSLLSQ
jgi:hypothetical protein